MCVFYHSGCMCFFWEVCVFFWFLLFVFFPGSAQRKYADIGRFCMRKVRARVAHLYFNTFFNIDSKQSRPLWKNTTRYFTYVFPREHPLSISLSRAVLSKNNIVFQILGRSMGPRGRIICFSVRPLRSLRSFRPSPPFFCLFRGNP